MRGPATQRTRVPARPRTPYNDSATVATVLPLQPRGAPVAQRPVGAEEHPDAINGFSSTTRVSHGHINGPNQFIRACSAGANGSAVTTRVSNGHMNGPNRLIHACSAGANGSAIIHWREPWTHEWTESLHSRLQRRGAWLGGHH